MTFILFTLPHLTCDLVCPISCLCGANGAVKCSGDTITDVPKQLPDSTFTLMLNGTNMNVINEQSLADQNLLLRFSLTNSHLHTIHPRAFHAAPQLKSVKLSFNDLSTLPARVFSPLINLEQLFLDGNQLETIAPDMFEGLVELQVLDLKENKLNNLPSDVFDGLTNLTFLNLGKNSIKKLPPIIFHSLIKLKELIIYHNELEVLEAGLFDGLVNLEELKIHYNHITSLPPRVFWSLRNLRTLTLSSNRLKAIPEKSFYNMPVLRKLTIYKNPLLSLPDQLMGHMPEMKDFYLFATNLTTVPGNLFANMSGLLSLNVHLNDWLHELPPDLFCCLPGLLKLSLRSNKLVYLHPQLFSGLTSLSMLLLNDNMLLSLPENIFQGLRGIAAIDLKNNNLTSLSGDTFLSNTVLRSLALSGNPWDCSCSIRGIAKWIRHNAAVVLDRDDVLCHTPVYPQPRTVGSLNDEEFNFCNATTVPSYFFKKKTLHQSTEPFHAISATGQTSAVASTAKPPTTAPTITQKATQQVSIATTNPTSKPFVFHSTVLSTPVETATISLPKKEFFPMTEMPATYISPPFYDKLVIEQGPDFVHHNLLKDWVYVWFLPSDVVLAQFLMFCHILLVATALFLILATIYGLYRLNKTMTELQVAHIAG